MKNSVFVTLATLLALGLLLTSEIAAAEQFIEDDQYVVHYSAFNSTLIQPQIAKTYGLMRSSQRGILNISVMRKQPDGSQRAVMSNLKGFTGQLGGSEIPLEFKIVTEGDAIYYLAEFLVREGDKLNFDVKISPTPDRTPLDLSFSQTFFED